MQFSTKKMGVNFFPVIKTKPGGGVRGEFGKRPGFFVVDIIDIIDVVDVVAEACEMI